MGWIAKSCYRYTIGGKGIDERGWAQAIPGSKDWQPGVTCPNLYLNNDKLSDADIIAVASGRSAKELTFLVPVRWSMITNSEFVN